MAMAMINDDSDAELSINLPTQEQRMLSQEGVCGNCHAENAGDDSVCCLFCRVSFHALCFTIKENKREFFQDNACTRSFLNGFNQSITNKSKSKRFGSFVFVCDMCLTKHENNTACKTNDRVNILDNKVSNLADDVTEIKKLLKAAIAKEKPKEENNVAISSEIPHPSGAACSPENIWSDKNRVKSLLVVAKDANVANADLEKTVVRNGIQVQKKYVNDNGDTVIICPNQKSRDSLKEKLTTSGVTANLLREPKERYPTISVVGIPKELDKNNKEIIHKTLLSQNPYISDCLKNESSLFDILSVKPLRANENVKQVFIRLSDDIRHAIKKNKDKMYFGLLSCSVYDQLYVKRCNKCQGFGHYAKDCSNDISCGICSSSDHETVNCIHKDVSDIENFYSCKNCLKAGKNDNIASHPAYSQECPTYRAKQEKLKASLSYYSKN